MTVAQLAEAGLEGAVADYKYILQNAKVLSPTTCATNEAVFEIGKRIGSVLTDAVLALTGVAAAKVLKVLSKTKAGAKIAKSIGKAFKGKNGKSVLENLDDVDDLPGNGGTGACFVAGTLILTKDGHKPIEEIKEGDEVYSEKPETGEKGLKKVINTFVHDKDTLLNVYVGETRIETTEEHPFWVIGKGWVLAGKLAVGDKLLLHSDEIVEITKLEIVHLEKPVKVYNFEVENWHTYFVSDVNVLVHNKAARYVPTNINKVDDKFLKKNGIDAHALKKENLGSKAKISEYDIYVDKDTGGLYIYRKGGKGEAIPTGEYIK
jgi:hypothetical protein